MTNIFGRFSKSSYRTKKRSDTSGKTGLAERHNLPLAESKTWIMLDNVNLNDNVRLCKTEWAVKASRAPGVKNREKFILISSIMRTKNFILYFWEDNM